MTKDEARAKLNAWNEKIAAREELPLYINLPMELLEASEVLGYIPVITSPGGTVLVQHLGDE